MRKNKMMRAASALLVAVLLTTSTISGTFAKYVTTNTATDTARVAKWGVELQVQGNLFGEAYRDDIIVDEGSGVKFEVEASDTLDINGEAGLDDVVAPGTKNEQGFTFSINGTPEVAGQIRIDKLDVQNIYLAAGTYGVMVPVSGTVTVNNFNEFTGLYKWDADAKKYVEAGSFEAVQYFTLEDTVTLEKAYYPVRFVLSGSTSYSDAALENDTLSALAQEVAEIIDTNPTVSLNSATGITNITLDETKKFDPNVALSTFNLGEERITWYWNFTNGDLYDKADTILGNLVDPVVVQRVVKPVADGYGLLEDNDYCLDVKFDLQITVEQINKATDM